MSNVRYHFPPIRIVDARLIRRMALLNLMNLMERTAHLIADDPTDDGEVRKVVTLSAYVQAHADFQKELFAIIEGATASGIDTLEGVHMPATYYGIIKAAIESQTSAQILANVAEPGADSQLVMERLKKIIAGVVERFPEETVATPPSGDIPETNMKGPDLPA